MFFCRLNVFLDVGFLWKAWAELVVTGTCDGNVERSRGNMNFELRIMNFGGRGWRVGGSSWLLQVLAREMLTVEGCWTFALERNWNWRVAGEGLPLSK